MLHIQRASFGHPTDSSRSFDVSDHVRGLVEAQGGSTLNISTKQDLIVLFRNPARPVRKMLKINYECVGLTGTVDVSDLNGKLQASIRLGYPPPPKPPPPNSHEGLDYPSDEEELEEGEGEGGDAEPPIAPS